MSGVRRDKPYLVPGPGVHKIQFHFSQREVTCGNASFPDLLVAGAPLANAPGVIFQRKVVVVSMYSLLRPTYKHLRGERWLVISTVVSTPT